MAVPLIILPTSRLTIFRSFIAAVLFVSIPAQAFDATSATVGGVAMRENSGPDLFQHAGSGEVVAILAFGEFAMARTFDTQTMLTRRVATELEQKCAEEKGRAIYKSLSKEKKEELKKRKIHYLAVRITPERKPAIKERTEKAASSTAPKSHGRPPSAKIAAEKKPAIAEGPAKMAPDTAPTSSAPPPSPRIAKVTAESGADMMIYGFESGTTANKIVYPQEHVPRSGTLLKLDGINAEYLGN